MHKTGLLLPLLGALLLFSSASRAQSPVNFVDAAAVVPGLVVDMRYHGYNNFVGRPIAGYDEPVCLLTSEAAHALARAQLRLRPLGLGLQVLDCYRPMRAVADFVGWARDLNDQKHKASHYPGVDKSELFARGYIAERSGHARGSTVDLTVIDLASRHALDMGTPYDWFGPAAWPSSLAVPAPARAHRLLLQMAMTDAGFRSYAQEWWHFTLNGERYPDQYFDVPVRQPR